MTGVKIEVRGFHGKTLPPRVPGEHLWIVIPMFRVNPTADRFDLDGENLLTVEGPGCYWCEQPWSESLSHQPCKGE